jgi:hypothetical protein
MKDREFNKVLDKYLTEGTMLSEDYENLDDLQKYVIQSLKRAFKRINKPMINEIHHSLKEIPQFLYEYLPIEGTLEKLNNIKI